MQRPLRLGTRGSPLALWQARTVRAALARACGWGDSEAACEIVVIRTTGDAVTDRPLAEIGGKGLFAKEIEERLLGGEIDFAVHSLKDMESVLPDGLLIAAHLPREDPRDAFIALEAGRLADLPKRARLGTSSVRRAAQLRRIRPDLEIVPFRGNVDTRLKKLADGVAAATMLACAGLKRLGLEAHITAAMTPAEMLPAAAQGIVAVECREDDADMRALLAKIDHGPTARAAIVERAFLAALDGSCRTPLAGHCTVDGDRIAFRGEAYSHDGVRLWETAFTAALPEKGWQGAAMTLGREAGRDIKGRADPAIFAA